MKLIVSSRGIVDGVSLALNLTQLPSTNPYSLRPEVAHA